MAITLTKIPRPLATPIGYNTPSAQVFAADYSILAEPSLNLAQLRSVRILGLLYSLANQTLSVNYKQNHKGLIADALTYTGPISNLDLSVALAATDWSAGRNLDATLATEVKDLLQEARDFLELPDLTQQQIIAFLRAQLGT